MSDFHPTRAQRLTATIAGALLPIVGGCSLTAPAPDPAPAPYDPDTGQTCVWIVTDYRDDLIAALEAGEPTPRPTDVGRGTLEADVAAAITPTVLTYHAHREQDPALADAYLLQADAATITGCTDR